MPESAAVSAPERPTTRVALALLALAAVALYAQSVAYGYTFFDDHVLLRINRDYLADAGNLLHTFREDGFTFLGKGSSGLYYRPLLWVSFILEEQLAPGSIALRHAVNVGLHALVVCGLFLVVSRFGGARAKALVVALLFALHPALVPAVAWVPGRNDLMLGVFALAALLSLLSFLERERLSAALLVVACVALALFTKESAIGCAVVLPVVVLARRGRDTFRITLPRAVLAAGCAGVVVLWLGMRRSALGGFPLSLSQVFANLPMALVYVGKSFVPVGLAPKPSVTALGLALGAAASGALLGLVWHSRDRLVGPFGVGLIWYGAYLFPAVLAPPATRGLEHRLYVPLLGLALALAHARWPSWPEGVRRLVAPALVALAVVFAGLSQLRLPDYREPVAFWESAAVQSPTPGETLEVLALVYYQAGRLEEAETACRRAIYLGADSPRLRQLLEKTVAQRAARGE